ncbi:MULTISPECIES: ATP phosphoribosyltransferase regulatory subunit [Enterococcus]|uniref:ATP phosphoribosyltransferase regulatory subunit n=1 Tax=Enterococcus sulfureus ATCC 49903 TaxID=1140003 RepID=S0NP06_9ENTE|nr:ATP phosphoribosyltransferase regulatory subunit [Enterococcus sulfureus]EOT45776.1 ATP phosphoribosyltransferase, regulatory subunit [Enterococcus sulfureus ATCC 49903]EOT82959.1 ATP phosphoribosyltransferase, regulatory subunit [Enterococcus sulfureus ATCC 49903]
MRRKQLPAGTKDRLFRRAEGVYQLEYKINELLRQRGFQRIETPIIEFAEVFEGSHNQEGFYRFFDNQGRLLTLRPDMTSPVGRVIASTKVELPLKLRYSGKVFRYHDEMKGLQNEFTQAGVEIIGFPSLKAEYEAILSADCVLSALNIPNYSIEIGHAGIFQQIVSELKLDGAQAEQLKIHFLNKSITDIADLVQQHPSSIDAFLKEIPKLFGDIESTVAKAKQLLPENHPILTDLAEIETLINFFSEELTSRLRVDLGMVGLMDYYTGIMFSSFSEGIPENFLSGGRYDYLFKRFDLAQTSSVGWAMNVDTLFDRLYQRPTGQDHEKILLYFEEDTAIHAGKWDQIGVELSLFSTYEQTLAYAKKWDYNAIWCIDKTGTKQEVNL